MILFKYIAKTVMSSILLATAIFFGLILFISVVSEMTQTGDGQYHFFQALHYVAFMLPLNLYHIFPMMVLVGVLLGLGSLSSTAELTVMRTSGISIFKITLAVLTGAVLLIVIATTIGEGIAPQAAYYANRNKAIAQNNGQIVSTLTGVWVKQDNDFFHIGAIPDSHHMLNITRFHFNDNKQLLSSSFAQSGQLMNGQWTFSNVGIANIGVGTVTIANESTVNWPLRINFHQFADIDPSTLTLYRLGEQIKNIQESGMSTAKYEIMLWSRIFQPLMTIIMVLVAIPFIFGPLRSVSIGLRLLSGVTVGLVFYIANQFVMSLGMAYQLDPIMVALTLPVLFLALVVVLFRWKA
jgi:lipopolysaccharide export system permease protein